MSEINDGGPAFPSESNTMYFFGMSLRDYFAEKVLPTIYNDSTGGEGWRDAVANEAYQLADAMIKAREKGQP